MVEAIISGFDKTASLAPSQEGNGNGTVGGISEAPTAIDQGPVVLFRDDLPPGPRRNLLTQLQHSSGRESTLLNRAFSQRR